MATTMALVSVLSVNNVSNFFICFCRISIVLLHLKFKNKNLRKSAYFAEILFLFDNYRNKELRLKYLWGYERPESFVRFWFFFSYFYWQKGTSIIFMKYFLSSTFACKCDIIIFFSDTFYLSSFKTSGWTVVTGWIFFSRIRLRPFSPPPSCYFPKA